MGRPPNPIEDDGPIGDLAKRLREHRAQASKKLTYRAMAALCHFSHSVLAEAASGKIMPTWPVVKAFVQVCGADDDEVKNWENYYLDTQRAVGNLRRKLGETDIVVPTRSASGRPIRAGRLRPIQPDIAQPDQCQPQPDQVRTYDDLHYQLQVLKIAVGNPSLRELHRRMDGYYGLSTLSEVFSGQRTPGFDLFMRIVVTLLSCLETRDAGRTYGEGWRPATAWRQAWSHAEFNRVRPDLTRRRRYGNLVLVTPDQDEGPTASVVAAMDTKIAAALLASLPSKVAAEIISEMPPKKAQTVLTAMWELTGKVIPSPPPVSATESDEDAEKQTQADEPKDKTADQTAGEQTQRSTFRATGTVENQ
ncbi:MAG: helix-turn-helix domain-containing protein [Pseudonocardiaceae bacterium]